MVPPEGTIFEILAATSTFSSYIGYAKTARFEALLDDPSQELTCMYWTARLSMTINRNHGYILFYKKPCLVKCSHLIR